MYGSFVSSGTRRPATFAPTSVHVAPPSVDLEMLAPKHTATPLPGVVEKYKLPSGAAPMVGSKVFSPTDPLVPLAHVAVTVSPASVSHNGGTTTPSAADGKTATTTDATRLTTTIS